MVRPNKKSKQSLCNLDSLTDDKNPVTIKRTLLITGDDVAVHHASEAHDDVPADGPPQKANHEEQTRHNENGGGQAEGYLQTLSERQLLETLLVQVGNLQKQVFSLSQQQESDRVEMRNQSRIINNNLRRIALNPAHTLNAARRAGGVSVAEGVLDHHVVGKNKRGANHLPPAELSSCPRTLYDLWLEYEEGIGGRKAARLFTAQERGRVKHTYTRRKIVWDLVKKLIRNGLSYELACDRIYKVYGVATPVTAIINHLKNDKKNGTLHPDLAAGVGADE